MPSEALEQLAASRGRTADDAIAWATDALARTPPATRHPERDWTDAELTVLQDEDININPLGPDENDEIETTTRRYLDLLADGLNVAEAATTLGVHESRIRQRLAERRLYGIRPRGRAWVLPRWQFTDDGLVPGIDRVIPLLDPELHPLTATGFLATPQPELTVNDQPVSPLNWLMSGGDVDTVIELATSLDM